MSPRFVGVLIGLIFLLVGIIIIGLKLPREDTRCAAEDEVAVEVIEDSFDFEEGDTLCVHIDKF